jgi:TonB family protein
MRDKSDWTGNARRIKKKSFAFSLIIHFAGIGLLLISPDNWIKSQQEIFIIQMVELPSRAPAKAPGKKEKPVIPEKKEQTQKPEKIKKALPARKELPAFSAEDFRKKIAKKIDVKQEKAKDEPEKNYKIDIPEVQSSPLSIENIRIHSDIPDWYLLLVKNSIRENWKIQNTFSDFSTHISFRIYRNGGIKNVVIEKSSGDSNFDRSVTEAIKLTKDLPEFPESIKKDYLDIIIAFKTEG